MGREGYSSGFCRMIVRRSLSYTTPLMAQLRSSMQWDWWPLMFGPVLAALLLSFPPLTYAVTGTADRGPLTVQFGQTTTSHPVMAVLAMPDASVHLSATMENQDEELHLAPSDHEITSLDRGQWRVRVPSTPGLYPLVVSDSVSGASVRLQVFVLSPWDHEGRTLNGYQVGRYQQIALEGRERYEPPTGFVRVTQENRDALVSPHFRLDQFLCKQTDETPQYALIHPRLLRTLEEILAELRTRGFELSTLHVMSGFRTPHYNRAIGNTTEYSRHLYGDAADIFVDADDDGWMDDLTGDGRVTRADAEYLAEVVRTIPTEGRDSFVGGLGIYGSAEHRGPFVHVDLRGEQARW